MPYKGAAALNNDLIGGHIPAVFSVLPASLGAIRYSKQDRVAENEETSPGYTLVNAHLAYRWERTPSNSWEVFLDGNNLTDQEVRPHTSLLRDYSPLPGRGVAFGLRAYF